MTLHIDIRCGMIHMMSKVIKAPYFLDQPVHEPDSNILALNADLLSFDDTLTIHLADKDYAFMTQGLGLLLDNILVTNASQVGTMNQNGCDRMQLNILVLQQNLRSVEKDVSLARSSEFFEWFTKGPKELLKEAKETGGKDMGFDLEEVKVIVELCYSEAMGSSQREVASQARKNCSDDTLELTEAMWSV
jgi:exocyst complex component 4